MMSESKVRDPSRGTTEFRVPKTHSERVELLEEFADHRLVVSAQNAFSKLSKRQKLLGEDFQRVLSDNLWDLYEE